MYLSAPEQRLLLLDLTAGPSAEFSEVSTATLPAATPVDPLRQRWSALLDELPFAQRVRRDDRGWHFEPTPLRPDLYVELHLFDSDTADARRRLAVECRRPLDPVQGPLGRASLLRYRTGAAFLVVSLHKLVATRRSAPQIVSDLVRAASLPVP